MQAVGYQQPGGIDREEALLDIEVPMPTPTGQDLLVQVKAVSVNPVDIKIRKSVKPELGDWKILG